MEIPEVDRFSNKFEASAVKQFITRRDDIYRVPFERRTTPHPRRCAFIASTNASDFLTDSTGNRRWWIVRCRATQENRGADLNELRRERDQVWAEAVALWRAGEPLTLEPELYAEATKKQESAVMDDSWSGIIAEFAARHVPEDWDTRKPEDRMVWWSNEFEFQSVGLVPRKKLCVLEVWCELFRKDKALLDNRTSRRIMNVLRRLDGWVEIGPRPTVYGNQKCFAVDYPKLPNYQNYRATKTTDQT